jgi:tRNA (cmo5U34)-methyltransferase
MEVQELGVLTACTSSSSPEKMGDFFDQRSSGYDAHMRQALDSFEAFYEAVAQPIPRTGEALQILDIGCGTGLELGPIFQRVPKAQITGIDLSAGMLAQLRSKHAERLGQIRLIQASYLQMPLAGTGYDYVISVMTLHHLRPATKRRLYEWIRRALKVGGRYIEGDYVVGKDKAGAACAAYQEKAVEVESRGAGNYHIDLPLTMAMQRQLLRQAGFEHADVIWAEVESAVYVAGP